MRKNIIIGIIAIVLIAVGAFELLHITTPTTQTIPKQSHVQTIQPPSSFVLDPKDAENSTGISPFYVGTWIEINNFNVSNLNKNFTLNIFNKLFIGILVHNSTVRSLDFVAQINITKNSQLSGFNKNSLLYALIASLNSNISIKGSGEYKTFYYVYGNVSKSGIALAYNGTYFVGIDLNGTPNNVNYVKTLLLKQINSLIVNGSITPTPPDILANISIPMLGWGYINNSLINDLNLNFIQNFTKIPLTQGYIGLYSVNNTLVGMEISQYKNDTLAENAYENIYSYLNTSGFHNISQGNINGAKYFSLSIISNSTITVSNYNNNVIVIVAYGHINTNNVIQILKSEIKVL
jgi:hypothetical protein